MNALRQECQDYVQMRRDLGFKFQNEERHLKRFILFMEERQTDYVTERLATEWALGSGGIPARRSQLIAVRGFARYLQGKNPRIEVPPANLIPRCKKIKPYLYTDDEIRRLMAATATLPCEFLRRESFRCVFGLLAVTGLRVSEALALERTDVDLRAGLLKVRNTKFGKSRIVPIHHSTRRMLTLYAKQRDLHLPVPRSPYFIVGSYGRKLGYVCVSGAFIALSKQIGLRTQRASHGPRIHDLRHRFAVKTLLGWYRSNADVQSLLPVLSTYLGHVCMQSTYWYLSFCPELMECAAQRLGKHWEAAP